MPGENVVFGFGGFGDERSVPRYHMNQVRGLQQVQRLPDGRAPCVEESRKFHFGGELFTWFPVTFQDQILEFFADHVAAVLSLKRSYRFHEELPP